ncbi:MAG: hypothetical protein GY774_14755 [Planctomycetes bacterium]|nr:hypothetical protein [Planctomycetota bacterium]
MSYRVEQYRGRELSTEVRYSKWNRIVGWVSLAMGAGTGLIMGLWSFDGPAAIPAWLGDYAETSRRFARLGHIAFFGLGILNILLARELPRFFFGIRMRQTASIAMVFGNVFLPLTLFAAAVYHPMKYLMALPAFSVFLALLIAVYGVLGQKKENENAHP